MLDITMWQATSTAITTNAMALSTPTEIPAGLLVPPSTVAAAATLKRVTFTAAANNEVFDVERVDASLIQELFYSSSDYRKFRRDSRKRNRRLASNDRHNALASPSAPRPTLRRESFQSMVAQRVYEQKQSAAGAYAPRSPEQRRVLRACELSTLRNMRTTAILSAATQ